MGTGSGLSQRVLRSEDSFVFPPIPRKRDFKAISGSIVREVLIVPMGRISDLVLTIRMGLSLTMVPIRELGLRDPMVCF